MTELGRSERSPLRPKPGLSGHPSYIIAPTFYEIFKGETVMHSSASDRVLVIMAKAPRPGEVKTRLTPSLSSAAVTAFYCCLLDDTLALARSLSHVEVAIMCPDSDVKELAQLVGNEASV